MPKKNKDEITSLEEAKQAMNDINKFDNLLASYYEQEANAVASIRSRFHTGTTNAKRQTLEGLKKNRIKQLENFAKRNRKEWDGKSVQTPFGSFGFRKGQPCVVLIKKVCKNFDEALEKIRKRFPDLVRIKEEINKEQILQLEPKVLTKENLEAVGLKVDSGEKFFIKTLATEKLEEATKELKSA